MAFAVLEFWCIEVDLRGKHPPPAMFTGLRSYAKANDILYENNGKCHGCHHYWENHASSMSQMQSYILNEQP